MIVFKKAIDIIQFLQKKRVTGDIIGFIPTMGALHQGHIALITRSKEEKDFVVCSIFINPTQFNNSKDFEKYPATIEADIDKLEKAGCDVLFLPSVSEMYPDGTKLSQPYPLGYLETVLEGEFRPGHFQGVCQIVERLLYVVAPQHLYLGQKDYQQCMVLKELVRITGINTKLIICPTLREADGLAMSSRNMRLNRYERDHAAKIFDTLSFLKQELKPGYLGDLKMRASRYLSAEGFKVDYVEIADADTLQPLENWDGKTHLVALVAAFLNDVRLIDNMLLTD